MRTLVAETVHRTGALVHGRNPAGRMLFDRVVVAQVDPKGSRNQMKRVFQLVLKAQRGQAILNIRDLGRVFFAVLVLHQNDGWLLNGRPGSSRNCQEKRLVCP